MQKKWLPLAKQEKVGEAAAAIPAELLPAKELFLRFKPATPQSNLQIDHIAFEGKLDGKPLEGEGQTLFADMEGRGDSLAIEGMSLGKSGFSGQTMIDVTVRNKSNKPLDVAVKADVAIDKQTAKGPQATVSPERITIPAGKTAQYAVNVPSQAAGKYQLSLECRTASGPMAACKMSFEVEDYYRSDYGKLISGGPNALWWCDATHKISPKRPAPRETATARRICCCAKRLRGRAGCGTARTRPEESYGHPRTTGRGRTVL